MSLARVQTQTARSRDKRVVGAIPVTFRHSSENRSINQINLNDLLTNFIILSVMQKPWWKGLDVMLKN